MKERATFKPTWPDGIEPNTLYRVLCDDKGRNHGSWLQVIVAGDGDVHVSMQDWEDMPEGDPSPFPSIRIRTLAGGGKNLRTRQALLWLADAIRRDTAAEAPPAEAKPAPRVPLCISCAIAKECAVWGAGMRECRMYRPIAKPAEAKPENKENP